MLRCCPLGIGNATDTQVSRRSLYGASMMDILICVMFGSVVFLGVWRGHRIKLGAHSLGVW
jgi:hypothetical protein